MTHGVVDVATGENATPPPVEQACCRPFPPALDAPPTNEASPLTGVLMHLPPEVLLSTCCP
eukprot:CAMPEP_0114133680 /NCGR_PEP_ID=MMETSP0043_2-20121206/13760_1 /TAXON_ID=464988 /ORGANISM="Hemiselmis andersenii, Strain CCMP644" /LENGTH=60 /DNA_ID=CAMNT_0001227283 /DNA_START=458 /DNA_END=636 /DNA_ORIENTATION=-